MTAGTRECPQCGTPIGVTSTALVCRGCIAQLAQTLRFLPEMLAQLEFTITHGTVTEVHHGPGTSARPWALEGPWHPVFDESGRRRWHECGHESCQLAFESQDAQARFDSPHREAPLPHEGRMPFGVDAVEVRDSTLQTVGAWARRVPIPEAAPSGARPRPRPRRRRSRPERVGPPLPPAAERPDRCVCCDLPLYSCHRRRSEISS